MIDDNEQPTATPMDRKIDESVKPIDPKPEKYSNNTESGIPVADKKDKEVSRPTEPKKVLSATMAELERMIDNDVLKPSQTKLDPYTLNQHRRSDFRLKNFSRTMRQLLGRQNQAEITTGAPAPKVREFDLQSQTMRMVSANATMGQYQFQKSMVLPYMRKSLALDYQKVTLLKRINTGIGTMEKSIVAKLDAIRLNTAAPVPRKESFLKRLMTSVKQKNMDRISTNISNLISESRDKMYRKYVLSTTKKIHDRMTDTSSAGGINGVRRLASAKLNTLRRKARDIASTDTTDASNLTKIKTKSAAYAAKFLGTTVRASQRVKLSDENSQRFASPLTGTTRILSKFSPFASPGQHMVDMAEKDEATPDAIDTAAQSPIVSTSKLLKSYNQWRKEYRQDTDKIIGHLFDISKKIGGAMPPSSPPPPSDGPWGPFPPQSKPNTPAPSVDAVDTSQGNGRRKLTLPKIQIPSIGGLKERVARIKPTIKINALSPRPITNKLSSIAGSLRRGRATAASEQEALVTKFREMTAPLFEHAYAGTRIATAGAASIAAAAAPIATSVTERVTQAGIPDKHFFGKMFGELGKRVQHVEEAIASGNTSRSRFEKMQVKWKEMADRARDRLTRKNSYEDVMAQKEKAKAEKKGILSRTIDRVKGVGANLKQGNLAGAALDAGSNILDSIKDNVLDSFGGEKAPKEPKAPKAKTSLKSKFGRLFGRGAAAATEEVAEEVARPRSLKRKAASLLWKGSKGLTKGVFKLGWGATKLGAKAAWGLTKFGGKSAGYLLGKSGGLALRGLGGLAKGLGPGLAVGIGADLAQGWIDKHTTGNLKRLGDTGTEALKWGATGATIGSIIPGLGTVAGGAIGASLGALVANADVIKEGLNNAATNAMAGVFSLGMGTVRAGKALNTALFGQDAKINPQTGAVEQKEKQSLLGGMMSSIFGRDAKYSKSGQLVAEGKSGLLADVRSGFTKFVFGDKDKQGSFIAGSSILSQMAGGVASTLESFKKTMTDLAGGMMDGIKSFMASVGGGASWLGDKAAQVGGAISGGLDSAMKYIGGMVGMSETANKGQIESYLQKGGQLTSIDPSTTAWCAAFVNATLAQAGIKGSGSLAASSFKNWGMPVDPRQVQRGDVLVEDNGASSGKSGDHVGLATGETRMGKNGELAIEMISGNSGNKVAKTFYPASRLKVRRAREAAGPMLPSGMTANNNPWAQQLNNPQGPLMSGYAPIGPSGTGAFSSGGGYYPGGVGFNGQAGSGGIGPGGRGVGGSAKAKFDDAVNYLMRKGWTKTAAMGMAGNLFGESQLDPTAVNKKSGAKGIAQWEGGRDVEIERRAGKPITSMSLYEQLDVIDADLRAGRGVTNDRSIMNGDAPIASALQNAPNIESVVQQMVYRYERPKNKAVEARRRIALAYDIAGRPGTDSPKGNPGADQLTAQTESVQAKPKTATAGTKPAKASKPAAAETPSWSQGLQSSIGNLDSTIKGMMGMPTASVDKPQGPNKTTVINFNTQNNNVLARSPVSTTMNMDKTTVRTGGK